MLMEIFVFLKNLGFIDYVFFFTVIFLLILVVSLIYFIKINEDVINDNNLNDPDNLQDIAKSIKNKKEVKPIKFTSYEKEQEDKAIISYEELLSSSSNVQLNYVEEDTINDDLSVKKFDLKNLVTPVNTNEQMTKLDVHVISLRKEEEFLKALKELQNSLN